MVLCIFYCETLYSLWPETDTEGPNRAPWMAVLRKRNASIKKSHKNAKNKLYESAWHIWTKAHNTSTSACCWNGIPTLLWHSFTSAEDLSSVFRSMRFRRLFLCVFVHFLCVYVIFWNAFSINQSINQSFIREHRQQAIMTRNTGKHECSTGQ